MKLSELRIELQSYGENKGKYLSKIEYEDDIKGSVKVLLDPEISNSLLQFIGPVLTKFAHQAALEIEKSIISSIDEMPKSKAISA